MYIWGCKEIYSRIKLHFEATEYTICDESLERDALNYPLIKDVISNDAMRVRTKCWNIYQGVCYLLRFICFLDVVPLVRCRKIPKRNKFCLKISIDIYM